MEYEDIGVPGEEDDNQEKAPQESPMENYPVRPGLDPRIIREFTTDGSIPADLKREWWSIFSKDGIFANLSDTDKRIVHRSIMNMHSREQMYKPYFKTTPDVIRQKYQILHNNHFRVSRAVGPQRERMLLSRQSEERRVITDDNKAGGGGFGGKIKSLFGFGGGGD